MHGEGQPQQTEAEAQPPVLDYAMPDDLAEELRKYADNLHPAAHVFPMPSTSGSVVDALRRDLAGAEIPWKLPTGEVIDFHTLRSTAITWWLDEDGLTPKCVQILARLKTLLLVQKYSRNLWLADFSWLNKGPRLSGGTEAARTG